jgi:transposase
MMPKIKYRFSLTGEERKELERIVSKGNHNSQSVLNALILLNCEDRSPRPRTLRESEIAEVIKVSAMKIYRVKQRFVEEGLEIALNGRKGQRIYERKADGEFEAHLIAVSCSKPPAGHSKWSLRLLAEKVVELQYTDSISHETIRRVLKKTNLSLGKKLGGSSRRRKTQTL